LGSVEDLPSNKPSLHITFRYSLEFMDLSLYLPTQRKSIFNVVRAWINRILSWSTEAVVGVKRRIVQYTCEHRKKCEKRFVVNLVGVRGCRRESIIQGSRYPFVVYSASGEISYSVLMSSWKLLTALNADLVGASDAAYSDLVSSVSSK
jgi:hypothetical protein